MENHTMIPWRLASGECGSIYMYCDFSNITIVIIVSGQPGIHLDTTAQATTSVYDDAVILPTPESQHYRDNANVSIYLYEQGMQKSRLLFSWNFHA